MKISPVPLLSEAGASVAYDYRDLTIETLTADVMRLEDDVEIYRTLAIEGIHALHAVTRQRDRLRRDNRELRDRLPREAA